jgi:hypothetical protein
VEGAGAAGGAAELALADAPNGADAVRQLKRAQGVRTPPAPLTPDADGGACVSPATSPTPVPSPKRTRIMPGGGLVVNSHWQGVG